MMPTDEVGGRASLASSRRLTGAVAGRKSRTGAFSCAPALLPAGSC